MSTVALVEPRRAQVIAVAFASAARARAQDQRRRRSLLEGVVVRTERHALSLACGSEYFDIRTGSGGWLDARVGAAPGSGCGRSFDDFDAGNSASDGSSQREASEGGEGEEDSSEAHVDLVKWLDGLFDVWTLG